jgi:hypothetical protein
MGIDPKDLSIHDEVVVETEIGGESFVVPAFVTNVVGAELWLACRLPEPRIADLATEQPIHLAFDRGALICESVFLRRLGGGRLGSEKSRVFAVKRPQGVETVQRRAHVRIDLERTVRIRSMGSIEVDKIGTGRTLNIGAGGVQFITEMPLIFGEQLRLALVLTARDIVIAGGTIVRIEDGDATPTDPTGAARPAPRQSKVAVRFDKITEADQERITYHILSAHRRRRAATAPPALPTTLTTGVAGVAGTAGSAIPTSPQPVEIPAVADPGGSVAGPAA